MSVKFDHVSYIYQANSPLSSDALEDITVSLDKHEFIALVGHTGSGKSTFAQQINALLKPSKGKVYVGDLLPIELQNKLYSLYPAIYGKKDDDEEIYFGYHERELKVIIIVKNKHYYAYNFSKKMELISFENDKQKVMYIENNKERKKAIEKSNILADLEMKESRNYLINKYLEYKKEEPINVFSVSNQKKIRGLKALKKYAGMVFQFPEYQLFEENVLLDVAFGPRNFGLTKDEAIIKAKEALKMVNISEELFTRSPFELSGGQKRRVAIAGIIALNPKILILDEPTAGLDPNGTKEIMALFEKLYSQGTNIIMITHDMDLVLKYANRVLVLNKGKLINDSSPLELFSKDDLEEKYHLEKPMVLSFAKQLSDNGLKIDLTKIKDLQTLIEEIKEVKHG